MDKTEAMILEMLQDEHVVLVRGGGTLKIHFYSETFRKTLKYIFSKCLLRHDVVRVFVSSLVLVFVRAILSWCP